MADRAGRKSGIPQICWGAWSQLFGREAERIRIEELLALASGGPVGIAVEGAPGIGKTTVWRDAVENARGAWLPGPGGGAERAGRGAGVLGAWRPVRRCCRSSCSSRLPDPQRRALSAALFLSEPTDAPVDVDALPRAVLGVLRQLAADATVVVAIDDEQWLDRASARVLAFALRRISEERICLLLSRRADSDGAALVRGQGCVSLLGLKSSSSRDVDVGPRPAPAGQRARVQDPSAPAGAGPRGLGRQPPLRPGAWRRAEARENGSVEDWRELPIPSTLADAIAQRLEHVRTGVEAPLFAIAALADPTVARARRRA